MSTRVVVRGVLLARDERLGVEESLVGSGADLVDHSGLEVNVDRARHVLALRRPTERVSWTDSLEWVHRKVS